MFENHRVFTPARSIAANLLPGSFSLVMATGILSIGTELVGLAGLSAALFGATVAFYLGLLVLLATRIALFPGRVLADLSNPALMFTAFCFVAASGVLGERAAMVGEWRPAVWLWAVTSLSWLFLIYYLFGSLVFRNDRPLHEVVDGGWLLAVVGTQSVAILTLATFGHDPIAPDLALLISFCTWTLGVVMYALIIGFIFLRLIFNRTRPQEISTPYWINMGAVAISTVAAASLLANVTPLSFLSRAADVVYAGVLALWAWGTWWIPLLIVMGVWKHVIHHERLHYEPAVWSIVFPLGMYSVATLRVEQLTGLQALLALAHDFLWLALLAWAGALIGMLLAWRGGKGQGMFALRRTRT